MLREGDFQITYFCTKHLIFEWISGRGVLTLRCENVVYSVHAVKTVQKLSVERQTRLTFNEHYIGDVAENILPLQKVQQRIITP